MKLRFSDTVIETDHIAYTQKLSHGTVRVQFISGTVPHSDGFTFVYRGTYAQLKAFIDKHKGKR